MVNRDRDAGSERGPYVTILEDASIAISSAREIGRVGGKERVRETKAVLGWLKSGLKYLLDNKDNPEVFSPRQGFLGVAVENQVTFNRTPEGRIFSIQVSQTVGKSRTANSLYFEVDDENDPRLGIVQATTKISKQDGQEEDWMLLLTVGEDSAGFHLSSGQSTRTVVNLEAEPSTA